MSFSSTWEPKARKTLWRLGVAVGDPMGFDIKYVQLGRDIVMGKAFDNRAGCVAMVEALKLMEKTDYTVYAVGTVQEEVGLRGAATAAFGVDPDFAIALDVTIAGDVPGVREIDTSVQMGKGPSLTISDSGLITHPKVMRWLFERQKKKKSPSNLKQDSWAQLTLQEFPSLGRAFHAATYPYPHDISIVQ